jgi:hypothetical protein
MIVSFLLHSNLPDLQKNAADGNHGKRASDKYDD